MRVKFLLVRGSVEVSVNVKVDGRSLSPVPSSSLAAEIVGGMREGGEMKWWHLRNPSVALRLSRPATRRQLHGPMFE